MESDGSIKITLLNPHNNFNFLATFDNSSSCDVILYKDNDKAVKGKKEKNYVIDNICLFK